uniref:Protein bric-a-brac 2 n=1 Tax=Lygus hesperus TaxID=30085 RepID=A0A0K8TGZ1_LYGHE
MDRSVYCTVRWSNHSNNVNRFLSVNYAEEKYTDVALACDGHILKAHKMILAGCSPYFEDLFSMYSVANLCVAVEGIAYPILQLVLEFMYSGEIRVKHSELENLVKAGVKLKVKGLDAIKLNDLARGAERTTVIARPTDSNPNHKVVKVSRPVPPSAPKSPQKPADPAPSVNITSPHRMEPLQVQQERLKPIPKPVTYYGQKPGATSTPVAKHKQDFVNVSLEGSKSSGSPSKQKLSGDIPKSDKDQSPATSPTKPGTLSSESKRKVGEWLDSLERTDKKKDGEEAVPEAAPRQTRKRATKPYAARAAKEPKVPRAVKRLRGTNGVEGDGDPRELLTPELGEEADPDPIEAPEKALSPLKETPVKNIPEPETQSAEKEDAPAVNPQLKEEVTSAIDSEEPHQDDVEPAPVTKKKEEITTTRSRTIKKPARMADAEFEFDTEVVHTKKRRTRKTDEPEESPEGEAGQTPEVPSSPKKRKGGFFSFCADFRATVQGQFPGENRKEINKRLGILWQQLDQAGKDKYQDPDSRPKKDK